MEAAWIPLSTEVSPYIGGGLGYMGAGGSAGMGAIGEAGLEVLPPARRARPGGGAAQHPLLRDAERGQGGPPARSVYPAAFVRLAF